MKTIIKKLRILLVFVIGVFPWIANTITAYANPISGLRISPNTGDSAAIFLWILLLLLAIGGIITAIVMIFNNRKK